MNTALCLEKGHCAYYQHPGCLNSEDRGIVAIKSKGCSIQSYSTSWILERKLHYEGDTTSPPVEPKTNILENGMKISFEPVKGQLNEIASNAKTAKTGKGKTKNIKSKYHC